MHIQNVQSSVQCGLACQRWVHAGLANAQAEAYVTCSWLLHQSDVTRDGMRMRNCAQKHVHAYARMCMDLMNLSTGWLRAGLANAQAEAYVNRYKPAWGIVTAAQLQVCTALIAFLTPRAC